MQTLRERWLARRNAWLADPAFQRWVTRFPLTRRRVRRDAARLFDRVTGFVHSQTILAAIESGLLDRLAQAPLTAAAFAPEAGLPEGGAERLLRAAAAIDLAEPLGDGRYTLGQQGAALLGNPGIPAMVRHHRLLYADMADPLGLLRQGRGTLADFWAYGQGNDQASADYSALMAASQPPVADQLLATYDFGRHRRLLDVGGGSGAFVQTAAARWPHLALSLFDLPAVAEAASARLPATITVHGGSFLADPLPTGADVITLIRILHDHDHSPAGRLLRAAFVALPPGGRLVVAEPMAEADGARPMGDGYFGFYLLAMGSGRPRSARQIAAMAREAGFSRAWSLKTPLPLIADVVVAEKR